MTYSIRITRTAEQDLNEAADYIEFVLKNPIASAHLIDLAEEKISSLVQDPMIYPVVGDPVLRSWGIRTLTVNSCLAFYTVDEQAHCIFIVRFLYGKRDWVTILRCGTDL